jgi:hypothetical protein
MLPAGSVKAAGVRFAVCRGLPSSPVMAVYHTVPAMNAADIPNNATARLLPRSCRAGRRTFLAFMAIIFFLHDARTTHGRAQRLLPAAPKPFDFFAAATCTAAPIGGRRTRGRRHGTSARRSNCRRMRPLVFKCPVRDIHVISGILCEDTAQETIVRTSFVIDCHLCGSTHSLVRPLGAEQLNIARLPPSRESSAD